MDGRELSGAIETARPGTGQDGFDLAQPASDTLVLKLRGDWRMAGGLPPLAPVRAALAGLSGQRRLVFDAAHLGSWDSVLVSFLFQAEVLCAEAGAAVDISGLPEGVRRLLDLAAAVPEREDAAGHPGRSGLVAAVGAWTIARGRGTLRTVAFVGEVTIALGRLLRGRARFRGSDFLLFAQECGAQALPIVTVISLLVGLILAFVGAVQLRQFGADIYVANLVAVAMSREMAAVMTAIVLAGRTGAAYAAQIGAMQGNEEIDALTTLGLPPVEFLVLPRVLALFLMTPLLCIYSNLLGIIGGYIVAIAMLNVTGQGYILQTQSAVTLGYFAIGIVKAAVFGLIIALAGCLKGIECGRSAQAVGDATTSAVVTGILFIIIADGLFAVVLNVLGI